MFRRILRISLIAIMFLNGLFFMSNIYVLGNTNAAIKMHEDLPSCAGAFMANTKVIICFLSGLLYTISSIGIFFRKFAWAVAGIVGFIMFDGFYIVEIAMWSNIHPHIWLYFSIIGSLSLLIGAYSWLNFNRR